MRNNPNRSIALRGLLAAVLSFSGSLAAQTAPPTDAPATPAHVATINLKLVLENMQATIDAQEQATGLQKQLDAMTKSHEAALTVLRDKAVDPAKRGTVERDADIDELDKRTFGFQLDEQTLKVKIQRLSGRQLAGGFREINAAVKDLATRKGYDVVVVNNGQSLPPNIGDMANQQTVSNLIFDRRVLGSDDQVDITTDIITQLNKGYKSPQGLISRAALPSTPMQIGSKTFQLEVAGDEPSREHGLMERDTLAGDHGMIFVFPAAVEQNFWMHHTRFPLDIIYADAQGKVVSIKKMKPFDESAIPSDGEAKYAIELSAGQAASAGVKAGDVLKIPTAADAPAKK